MAVYSMRKTIDHQIKITQQISNKKKHNSTFHPEVDGKQAREKPFLLVSTGMQIKTIVKSVPTH
jgi:hypothetical protein